MTTSAALARQGWRRWRQPVLQAAGGADHRCDMFGVLCPHAFAGRKAGKQRERGQGDREERIAACSATKADPEILNRYGNAKRLDPPVQTTRATHSHPDSSLLSPSGGFRCKSQYKSAFKDRSWLQHINQVPL